MRQIFITIIMIAASMTTSALTYEDFQYSQPYDSVLMVENGETVSKTIFIYDEKGNVLDHQYFSYNGGETTLLPHSRRTYSYNDANYPLVDTWYNAVDEDWEFASKRVNSYSEDGLKSSSLLQQWDSEQSSWIDVQEWHTSYSSVGLPDSSIFFSWSDDEKKLILDYLLISDYDQNSSNLLSETSYLWDSNSLTWVGNERASFFRDDNGALTMRLYQNFGAEEWKGDRKHEYTNDDSGRSIETISSVFIESTWKERDKDVDSYDEKGTQTRYSYRYNIIKGDWETQPYFIEKTNVEGQTLYHESYSSTEPLVGSTKFVNSYSGKIRISTENFNWDNSIGSWTKASKDSIEVNSNGKVGSQTSYIADADGNWVAKFKYSQIYEDSEDITSCFTYSWDNDEETWEIIESNKLLYYRSSTTTVTTPMQKEGNSLLVAPTPTKDAAKVFATSDEDGEAVFTIYTASAKKVAVLERAIEADEQTKFEFEIIERLPKGIYFVEMKVNGNVKAVTKLVKL